MNNSKETAINEYRMSAANRRCAIYMIIASALAVPCLYLTIHLKGGRFVEIIPAFVVCPLLIPLLTYPLFWKLRVDENGLSRRRFWFWDHWSWDDFATGAIEKRESFQLYDPKRRLGFRCLDLGCLDRDDRREVIQAINRYYRPVAVDVREELVLTTVYRKSKKVVLNQRGMIVCSGQQDQFHSWDDISLVQFVRYDEVRNDFRNLLIRFSKGEVELVPENQIYLPIWRRFRGATAEEVSLFILSHVEASCVDERIVGRIPRTCREIENELKDVLAGSMAGFLMVALVMILLAFEEGTFLFGFVAVGSMAVVFALCHWAGRRRRKELIKELEGLIRQAATDE